MADLFSQQKKTLLILNRISGGFLISYISAWQSVLNRLIGPMFDFNTYIISVLAIFFLQVNYKLPSNANFSNLVASTTSNVADLSVIPRQFFEFYGSVYNISSHVISTNVGRLLPKNVSKKSDDFSVVEKLYVSFVDFYAVQNWVLILYFLHHFFLHFRLHAGIDAFHEDWTDCAMCVQDLVRPYVNITAEIPPQAAENFQKMCRLFSKIT